MKKEGLLRYWIILTIITLLITSFSPSPNIAKVKAQTETWTSNGLSGKNITTLVVDPTNPNVIYAGSYVVGVGIYKSVDGGDTWQPKNLGLSPYMATTAIAVDPHNPQVLFASALCTGSLNNGGIYRSVNGGDSWTMVLRTPILNNCMGFWGVAIDPNNSNVIYGVDGYYYLVPNVYKSTDAGNTWAPKDNGMTAFDPLEIFVDPVDSQVLYVTSARDGVYKSTDGAESWAPARTGLPGGRIEKLVIDPNNDQILYAGTGDSGGLYKSIDGGASWTQMANGLNNYNVLDLAIDPQDPDILYSAPYLLHNPPPGIYRTENGGRTWDPISDSLPSNITLISALAIRSGTAQTLLAGTSDGVWEHTLRLPPPPGPTPFLDLPWNYKDKGMDFSDSATEINSYFDHKYPLLSTNLKEPTSASGSVTTYMGITSSSLAYSSHDGYDYGSGAGTKLGEPVLAAAAGMAVYKPLHEVVKNGKKQLISDACGSFDCGNAMLIDHGNGYQTRYYHLEDTAISRSFMNPTFVNQGQEIGLVGFSGNVKPSGSNGSHLHFMVVQDKDGHGDFSDNIPDGITDPYGWQSKEQDDPWPNYEFNYKDAKRTGDTSYYLWTSAIANLSNQLSANGGFFQLKRFSVTIPADAITNPATLNMSYTPDVTINNSLKSIGPVLSMQVIDPKGTPITTFNKDFVLKVNFAPFDLSSYNLSSLSFYSSEDGINWIKENTIVDPAAKTATMSANHLSYFALVGERKDVTPPVTSYTLSGKQGITNWYRSNVAVTLNPVDNEGGLGVDYTAYKIDYLDWQQYKGSFTISDEGEHTVEFYSVDKDDNAEETKSVTFNIDKTPPTISLDVNPAILWPPNSKTINVNAFGNASDNNTLDEVVLSVNDEYQKINLNETVPVANGSYSSIVPLEASRYGDDMDGRHYTITVTAYDLAGNAASNQSTILVPHDQGIYK